MLREGDRCGFAHFLVALGGGGIADARMSADDRGGMGIGDGGDNDRSCSSVLLVITRSES